MLLKTPVASTLLGKSWSENLTGDAVFNVLLVSKLQKKPNATKIEHLFGLKNVIF